MSIRVFRMAPTSFRCTKCDNGLYGRQKRLACKQCNEVFHTSCIDVRNEDLEFLVVNGVSNYVCEDCMKLQKNDSTPISIKSKAAEQRNTVVSSVDGDSDISHKNKCYCSDLHPILVNFRTEMDQRICSMQDILVSLVSVVQELSMEKKALKEKLAQVMQGSSMNEMATVAVLDAQNSGNTKSRRSKRKNCRGINGTTFADDKSASSDVAATGSSIAHNSVEENFDVDSVDVGRGDSQEAWTVVGSKMPKGKKILNDKPIGPSLNQSVKGKKKAIVGEGDNNLHLVRVRRRALFVTRFHSSTMATDVKALITSAVNVNSVICTRLKTKFDSYNSFYVDFPADAFDSIAAPEVWPKGVLVLPYYGRLSKKNIYEENSLPDHNNSVTQEEGNNPVNNES